ncbi:MAG TPA: type II toxin-antitoxin system RelE/ParE family toxin [Pseudoxanthomonas sp.]
MSKASSKADPRAEDRIERWQHWIAVLSSALLHLLFLFLAMWSSAVPVTTAEGGDAGSRMAVDFIGVTPPTVSMAPARKPAAPAAKSPAKSRARSTPVTRADDPVPPDSPDDAAQGQAQAPAASSPQLPQRRSHVWGQPPGMLQEDVAPVNAGLARSAAAGRGRRSDASSAEPSLEVGGYQVYYDLRSETRLRAWRDQGVTELFMPLPGTRRYMVCPLETALRRESGPCRLLEPDSPELETIGDAREVINMQQVYRQGEPVWRGPGPYK